MPKMPKETENDVDHRDHGHSQGHGHSHKHHGHSHGRIDPSIARSRDGLKVVGLALLVLLATFGLQLVVFLQLSNSVALFGDLIHNGSDALTAIPLAVAFILRSAKGEQYGGYFVVFTIFASAVVVGWESIERMIHPQTLTHLAALSGVALLGFAGNWIAALVRTRGGKRLDSPALIADGHHAKVDALVSLSVLGSVIGALIGFARLDPIVGLLMTVLILRITWDSWNTVRAG